MTKALTRGAKRRKKRDREPDPISAAIGREPSGKRQRESVTDALSMVGRRRCRVMGWEATPEAITEAARDGRLLTLPGRRMAAQRLSARAYEAIMQYALTHERWLEAISAPSPHPSIGSYGDATHGHEGEERPEWKEIVRKRENAFMLAEGVLIGTKRKDQVTASLAAPEDVSPMHVGQGAVDALEYAGKALARHFGL